MSRVIDTTKFSFSMRLVLPNLIALLATDFF
jgi:hypothetical protein